MINRKKKSNELTLKEKFWGHFHHMLDISKFGNEKIIERLDNYSSVTQFFEKNYLLGNIPEKYFDFELENIRHRIEILESNIEEFEKAKKYIDSISKAIENGVGLYIHGPHGVGKTALAAIVLKTAIKQYYSAFFSRSTEVVEFARSGWRNENKKAYWTYVVNNSSFFVIDDIGRLFSDINEAERIHIDEIFTKRDDSNLCTIITSNHSLDDNKDLCGDALYSSFKERLIEIKFLGEDYRSVINESLIDKLK
jgi:DNA replication protein DnaC